MGSGPQGREVGSSTMKAPRLPVQWEEMGEPLGADTEGHVARIREHVVQKACIYTPATQRASLAVLQERR